MQVVLSPQASLFTKLAGLSGIHSVPDQFGSPNAFPSLYVWSGVWQETGYGASIYLAALSAVSPTLYEAARLDGASRFKDLACRSAFDHADHGDTRRILGVGTVINVGFEKAYLLQSPLNLSQS